MIKCDEINRGKHDLRVKLDIFMVELDGKTIQTCEDYVRQRRVCINY
jgi:hypothetical protein